VSPNFVLHSHAVLRSTRERPAGAGFDDAFNTATFPRFQQGGSRASVTAAWQWVAAHGIARRVRVAIIDGGFWLSATGQPLTAPGDGTDLPGTPIQYDFVGDDFIAGAMNPATCTGGAGCPWHGNGSASVATGLANNSAAAAGTGGTVADPMLFHTDIRDRIQRDRAARTAVAWGADVISMSFGGPCNYACRSFERRNDTDRGYREAVARGIVLVASAGNDTSDVGADNFYHPCITDGVICVGALADNGTTAAGISNYGAGLDIWAPTNVRAMANGVTTPALSSFGGTSASAPFVAGIAAMVKAINPALNSDQVRDLLREAAWTDSTDGKVSHYVNAYEAVRRASGFVLPPDRFEANDTPAAAKAIGPGQYDDLTLHAAADRDYLRLTVGGHATVSIDAVHAEAIGRPYIDFSKGDACGGATQVSAISEPNHRRWTYAVTPGQYLIRVSGGLPLPYDLGITTSATALARDAFEGPTNNDDFSRAFPLGQGGGAPRSATIFPGGDTDFYRVESTGSIHHPKVGGVRFTFAILAADVPVTVDLFDAGGTLVQTLTTSPDCQSLPSLALASGTFFVRVRAASPGGYTFGVGQRHDSGILYDMRAVWRLLLDPTGPIQIVVRNPRERYAFVRGREQSDAIDVIGAGLRAMLLDADGQVVAEGQPDPHEGTSRLRIPLDGTVAGESYVIVLERDLDRAPERGMPLPALPAQLALVRSR
jgi:hypothetical protein